MEATVTKLGHAPAVIQLERIANSNYPKKKNKTKRGDNQLTILKKMRQRIWCSQTPTKDPGCDITKAFFANNSKL